MNQVMKMKEYKLYINGKWVKSKTGNTFKNINPATGKTIGIFQKGGREDVKKALDAAEKAFSKWRDVPAPKKGEILFKTAAIMEKRKEELAKTLTEENGKNLEESLGEVQEGIDIIKYIAGEGRRLLGETTPSELKGKFCMTVRQPIGVVSLISPWNFPFAIPCWKLAPALIAGNTVVFKPATDTPLCGIKIVEIFVEAGVPPGALNLVTGSGSDVGDEMAKNPKSKATSFTGSSEVGRSVYASAAPKLSRIELEMGGKNAQIVLADADLGLAVDGAIWGSFGTAGQRCTATSRIIVEKAVLRKFTNRFLARAKKIKVGPGLEKGVLVGPIINKRQMEKILEHIEIGKKEGAKLLLGGRRLHGKKCNKGFFISPTVFGDVKKNMKIAQEEIFGPVVAIMPVKDFDEAIKVANSTKYGLASSIYTQDINKAFKAIDLLEAGIVYVNAPTIGAEVHLPFGGVKETGTGGREAGTKAIDEFTEIKTVFIDYSNRLQRAQIDVEY